MKIRENTWGWSILLVLPLGFLIRCSAPEKGGGELANQEPFRIYYAANRQGEIAPCGCQVNQLGGLNRFQAGMAKVSADAPKAKLFLDAGDTFFTSRTLNPNRKASEVLAAELIADAYKLWGVSALAPGERDFALGVAKLKELEKRSGAMFIASNLTDASGKPLFRKTHFFSLTAGISVGVFALAAPENFEGLTEVKVADVEAARVASLEELKARGVNKIVLLSHLGLQADREIAAKGGIDLIIGSHSLDVLTEPVKVGTTLIVQPQNQGQQLGYLDFGPSVAHKLVDLDKSFDEQNELFTKMEAHKESIRKLALAEITPPLLATKNKPYVAHAQSCRVCHQKQHDFWAGTKHASAYLVLYAKNQHFDAECIGCHSLGFQQAGGFDRIARPLQLTQPKLDKKDKPYIEEIMKWVFAEDRPTPLDSRTQPERYQKLKARYHEKIKELEEKELIQKLYVGVQCENCHGNRNGHPSVKVATQKKVNPESCKQCHAPPNAAPFDPESIPKVACPLSSSS